MRVLHVAFNTPPKYLCGCVYAKNRVFKVQKGDFFCYVKKFSLNNINKVFEYLLKVLVSSSFEILAHFHLL